MKNILSLNLLVIIAIIIALYSIDYLLLKDYFLQKSILSLVEQTSFLNDKKHALIHGLIPICIAIINLGASLFGAFLGMFLHGLLFTKQKTSS